MALPYSLKQAVAHATPTITVDLARVIIPPPPEAQNMPDSAWPPSWLEWRSYGPGNRGSMNLWAEGYYSSEDATEFTGIKLMAVGDHDHCLRTIGTAETGFYGHFSNPGYHHETFFGQFIDSVAGTTADVGYLFQAIGPASGGESTAGTLGAIQTDTLDFGVGYTLGDIGALSSRGTIQAQDSTVADPAALALYNLDATVSTGCAVKITESGISLVGLFECSAADQNVYIEAGISDATAINLLAQIYTIDEPARLCLVTTEEQAFPADTFTIERVGFDAADLPDELTPTGGAVPSGDPYDFYFMHMCGTELGWVLSYLERTGEEYNPKFLLVSRDWATFQRITTTGDATHDAIIAQASGITDLFSGDYFKIGLTYGGGLWSLLGGSVSAPLLVQSPSTADPGDADVSDSSPILRSWAFRLDGHEYYVLRLGEAETLVFDRLTQQWSHWQSPDRTNWRAHVGCNWQGMAGTLGDDGTDIVAGDDSTGVLWRLDPTSGRDDRTDTGDDAFSRVVTGAIPLDGRDVLQVGAIQITVTLGAPSQAGASLILETSTDLGHTWVNHGEQVVAAGAYSQVVEWRGCGIARQPGLLARITDDGATVRIGRAQIR